jgi:lipoic acid synthetase
MSDTEVRKRHPEWLKVKIPGGEVYNRLKAVLKESKLHTVCEEARCPNIGECWGRGVATFMILGDVCTRGCRYCAVSKGKPVTLDLDEPRRVADTVKKMGLRHAVITSVDRDDLPDGGAGIFAEIIHRIKEQTPDCTIEVLIPDFQGSYDALRTVLDAGPHILNHNMETVPRLYKIARGGGVYSVSLELLRRAKEYRPEALTKTGMMLGLGEEYEEIVQVMRDLVEKRVDILTLGQYLRPTAWHLPIARYYHPDEFARLKALGESMGIGHVEAGPLVRSSYHADSQVSGLAIVHR